MRKKLRCFFSVLLLFILSFEYPISGILLDTLTIQVFGAQYDVLTYTTDGTEITITRCDPSVSGFYAVPSEINGLPVTSIGDKISDWEGNETAPFRECKKLTGIILPDTVRYIGKNAFRSCSALRSITIPDSVEEIGADAFYDTAYFSSSYNWQNGLLYIGNCLIRATNNGVIGTLYDDTRLIADHAFDNCKNITSVIIPDSVDYIGAYAFYGCTSLSSVSISDHVTDIGFYAFFNTGFSNSQSNWENGLLYLKCYLLAANREIVDNSCVIRPGTKMICANAFSACECLTEITMPDSIVRICEYAFWHDLTVLHFSSSLEWIGQRAFGHICNTDLVLPDGVKYIGYGAFANSALQTVYIPQSVTHIGAAAFFSETLSCIEVNPENPFFCSENGVLFNKEKSVLLAYPCNTPYTTYTIPASVQYIDAYAFLSCKQLHNINIPDSVKQIGANAFGYCGISFIDLPDSIVRIGKNAFEKCPLRCLNIPSSVQEIDYDNVPFGYFVDEQNAVYSSDVTGALYNKDKTVLYHYPFGNEEPIYIIPNGVRLIENSAFSTSYESALKHIGLPDSLEEIGANAFNGCKQLQSITIPNSVQKIGIGAFSGCKQLKTIVLPQGIKEVGFWTFAFCRNLRYVHVPVTVSVIDQEAFYGCDATLCSETENSYAKHFADEHNISFHVCDGVNHKGASVAVQPSELTILYKQSAILTVSTKNIENGTVLWSSSDNAVATVDATTGEVIARRLGTTEITCTVTDCDSTCVTDACTVTVRYSVWQWLIRIFLLGFLWY